MKIYKVLLLLLIILLCSVFSINYLIFHEISNDVKNTIRFEIIKSLLGVISIAIIGGVISAILKSYERSREQSNLRVQAKIDFMKKTDELYRAIKSSRRKLFANGIKPWDIAFIIPINQEQIQVYLKEMEIVNNIQLEFEGISVSVNNHKLFNYPKAVSENIKQMEKYLRELLKESEDNFVVLNKAEYVNLNTLPILEDFTNKKADSNFQIKFSKSYYEIISHLR